MRRINGHFARRDNSRIPGVLIDTKGASWRPSPGTDGEEWVSGGMVVSLSELLARGPLRRSGGSAFSPAWADPNFGKGGRRSRRGGEGETR